MDDKQIYAALEMVRTWGSTAQLVWIEDLSGVPWLAQVWQCRETSEVEYRPLPTVKLPSPSSQVRGQ